MKEGVGSGSHPDESLPGAQCTWPRQAQGLTDCFRGTYTSLQFLFLSARSTTEQCQRGCFKQEVRAQQRGKGRGPAYPSSPPCVSEGHHSTTERDKDVCTVRPDNLHVLLLLKPRLGMWWNPKKSLWVLGKVAALGPGSGNTSIPDL